MTELPPNQPDGRLRILVVDADERVRESLAGLLGIGQRCVVVGSAGHPAAALALIAADPPDIVMLDPRLPDVAEGRAFIAQVRLIAPTVRVILMGSVDPAASDDLAGAHAVIRKTFRPRELQDAIRAVAALPG
jgi:DNA-binding NarL/FixJ family response regulator